MEKWQMKNNEMQRYIKVKCKTPTNGVEIKYLYGF